MKELSNEELEDDTQIFHMWEPFNFKIKDNYKYICHNWVFNMISSFLTLVIYPILYVFNKVFLGFKIENKEKLKEIKGGKVTISNHIHPLDCTMNGIINFPNRVYFPTLSSNFKIPKEKLKEIKGGKVTISNHIHPLDCTMNGIINFPNRVYFPTLSSNFKIPIVRHLIRILYAIPIPSKVSQKERFLEEINKALKNEKTIHMYPEGALWPYYEKIRKFKNGAFKIAVKADVPIVPILYVLKEPKEIYKLYMNGIINFPNRVYFPTLSSNFKIPIVRHLIRILYAIPIPSKVSQKERFLEEINKALKNEKTIHMYPEGALWPYYEKIRKFKNGAFKIAVKADVPIVPILYVLKEPKEIYKLYKKKKCIHAVVLDPIYPNKDIPMWQRAGEMKERAHKIMNDYQMQ